MIDFNQGEQTKKIQLNAPISFGAAAGPLMEANPNLTRAVIEEEKAFRRGVLSVRDIIAPASLKVEANYFAFGQSILPDDLYHQLSALYFRRLVRADHQSKRHL